MKASKEPASKKPSLQELKARSKSLADGTAKSYTWEETKKAAIKKVKSKK